MHVRRGKSVPRTDQLLDMQLLRESKAELRANGVTKVSGQLDQSTDSDEYESDDIIYEIPGEGPVSNEQNKAKARKVRLYYTTYTIGKIK